MDSAQGGRTEVGSEAQALDGLHDLCLRAARDVVNRRRLDIQHQGNARLRWQGRGASWHAAHGLRPARQETARGQELATRFVVYFKRLHITHARIAHLREESMDVS